MKTSTKDRLVIMSVLAIMKVTKVRRSTSQQSFSESQDSTDNSLAVVPHSLQPIEERARSSCDALCQHLEELRIISLEMEVFTYDEYIWGN